MSGLVAGAAKYGLEPPVVALLAQRVGNRFDHIGCPHRDSDTDQSAARANDRGSNPSNGTSVELHGVGVAVRGIDPRPSCRQVGHVLAFMKKEAAPPCERLDVENYDEWRAHNVEGLVSTREAGGDQLEPSQERTFGPNSRPGMAHA
eukprot:1210892-Prymnesium_polylepis.2